MMRHLTGLIDTSAWAGTWPFDLSGFFSLRHLADGLSTAGVVEALVSPLAAVTAPDPMPANRSHLEECVGVQGLSVKFHPVPVINPVLATWQSDLASIVEQGNGAIPAVRLLPTWHGWGPDDPEATVALRMIGSYGLVPIIQARMVDERSMPVAASPGAFQVEQVAYWLKTAADVPVMLAGLYRSELPTIAGLSQVAVDLSFVESGESLATALDALPPERVLLGTHVPMLEPLGAVVKLPVEGPHREVAVQIGTDSARSWFHL